MHLTVQSRSIISRPEISRTALPAQSVPMGYSGMRHDPLSARELEVLPLLARGLSNPEIARCLTITNHTVKSHVEHILAKLGASDRTHAAVRAIELGYLKVGGDQESPMATCSTCAMPEQLGNHRGGAADRNAGSPSGGPSGQLAQPGRD